MKKLKLMSFLVGMAALLTMQSVWANPAPFGLELGKATIQDVKQKYDATLKGINKYSLGKMFSLPPGQLGIDGLKSSTVIFNREGKLIAVLNTLPNYKFDSLYSSLRSKYQVQSSDIPFVGNKKVVMKDGDTQIILDSPHMSFDMELNYINDAFLKAVRQQQQQERQQKQSRELNNL